MKKHESNNPTVVYAISTKESRKSIAKSFGKSKKSKSKKKAKGK
jgi:hypothetical protein